MKKPILGLAVVSLLITAFALYKYRFSRPQAASMDQAKAKPVETSTKQAESVDIESSMALINKVSEVNARISNKPEQPADIKDPEVLALEKELQQSQKELDATKEKVKSLGQKIDKLLQGPNVDTDSPEFKRLIQEQEESESKLMKDAATYLEVYQKLAAKKVAYYQELTGNEQGG